MANSPSITPQFYRIKHVTQILSISKTAWLNGVREGRFPRPVRLGPRSIAWRRADIENLVAELGEAV